MSSYVTFVHLQSAINCANIGATLKNFVVMFHSQGTIYEKKINTLGILLSKISREIRAYRS